ncbi:MAG: hypothetical protein QM610_02475 [Chitinophagaceae bacterium]
MKEKLLVCCFLVALILNGCKTVIHKNDNYKNIDLIKKFAYCKCMQESIQNFVGRDSIDYGLIWTKNMLLDKYGRFYAKKINPLVDSFAHKQFLKSQQSRFPSQPVAEGAYGKAAYTLDCLHFYNSEELDSLAWAFTQEYNSSNK